MLRRRGFWLVVALLIGAAAGGYAWLTARDGPQQPAVVAVDPFEGIVPPVRMAPTLLSLPELGDQATFVMAERTVRIEMSEYAGYAGLIAANGGLRPSENSLFFRNYGFKVELTLSEREGWAALNQGRLGAVLTTADVAALHAAQFAGVVPVLVSYSRGANGIVVRRGINSIGDLKGRVVATAQFTEAEFLVRYLAERTDVPVSVMTGIGSTPDPSSLNLVFAEDGFAACDLLLHELVMNRNRVHGCSAWEPRTSETVDRSGGAAHLLTTNRNLLIVADILAVNTGFAAANPDVVDGLVEGILRGNDLVRNGSEAQLLVIADAFGWRREQARHELRDVHLANLPENIDFFAGDAREIGSFAHIYETTLDAYGPTLIPSRPDRRQLLDLRPLKKVVDAGLFRNQLASIEHLRSLSPESEPFEGMPKPQPLNAPHTLPDLSDFVPASPPPRKSAPTDPH
jgi:NitT/TauT family transport system substrate-binding protein